MQIIEENGIWIARSSYAEKDIVKAAGFRWNPTKKIWYTNKAEIAAKLSDPDAPAKIQAELAERAMIRSANVEASRAASADIDLPCPEGLAYLPYQRAGIATGISRPNVYFGDDMGLGKTIQAVGMINADPTLGKILIVCPASLRLNWKKELTKWLVRSLTFQIVTGPTCHPSFSDVTIINYDNLAKHAAILHATPWDLVVLDESHYLKNPKAKRTEVVVGARKKDKETGEVMILPELKARRIVALSGTPIPNRPIEGWSLFHYLAPQEFPSFMGYAKRYCAGYQNGYGWDFSGASHLDELQETLRASIMIRRLKMDVLTELPAKRRQVIEIPANGASAVVEAEREAFEEHKVRIMELRAAVELAKASDDPEEYRDAVYQLRQAARVAFTEMSQRRHDTAVAKIPYVLDHVRDCIEDGKKVIVFAHHHDVIEAIAAEFGSAAVTVYGRTSFADRNAAVERFQSDPTCTVFVGGILAAGVGLTLTASSHVIFAELDWVPGNVTQAEDRAHRIGQVDMVLVQHLVLEGSLDARMANILVEKQEVIYQALDKAAEPGEEEIAVPVAKEERAVTESITRKEVIEQAPAMTADQIAAIHRGLQILSGMCDGAATLDDAGFNKCDSRIGKSLAQEWELTARQAVLGGKLVNKYRRQLPVELLAAAKG